MSLHHALAARAHWGFYPIAPRDAAEYSNEAGHVSAAPSEAQPRRAAFEVRQLMSETEKSIGLKFQDVLTRVMSQPKRYRRLLMSVSPGERVSVRQTPFGLVVG